MNKVLKISLSLAVATLLSCTIFTAGCDWSDDNTINIDASESTSSGDTTVSTNVGDSDNGNSSSEQDDNSVNDATSFVKSEITADYSMSDGETYSVAENLLSAVTVYASSTIETTTTTNNGWGFGPGGGGTSTTTTYDREVYTGSGVIYSITEEYIYVVTCFHVVYSKTLESVANEYLYIYLYGSEYDVSTTSQKDTYGYVYDYGDTAITCEFVGGSWAEDVAVLRAKTEDVYAINDQVKSVKFSDNYSVGDTVTAIGNYAGEGLSVTQGIISIDSEEIELTLGSTTNTFRVMRLDLSIYSGDSGCGLFDSNGYYIGMINAISTVYTNFSFAIPATVVRYSIDNIIYYSNYSKMYTAELGIEVDAASSKYSYDNTTKTGGIVEEVEVTSVTPGSVAEDLGLQEGDVITAITVDDTVYDITRTYQAEELMLIIFPDLSVTITYERDGTEYTTSAYAFTLDDVSLH